MICDFKRLRSLIYMIIAGTLKMRFFTLFLVFVISGDNHKTESTQMRAFSFYSDIYNKSRRYRSGDEPDRRRGRMKGGRGVAAVEIL